MLEILIKSKTGECSWGNIICMTKLQKVFQNKVTIIIIIVIVTNRISNNSSTSQKQHLANELWCRNDNLFFLFSTLSLSFSLFWISVNYLQPQLSHPLSLFVCFVIWSSFILFIWPNRFNIHHSYWLLIFIYNLYPFINHSFLTPCLLVLPLYFLNNSLWTYFYIFPHPTMSSI